MQAIPSPRPIQPMPSLVVALTLTRADVASASTRSISALWRSSRGRSQTTVASTLTIRPPTVPTAVRSRSIESASRQRSSSSGKSVPMSPAPAAPSRASITAWVRTSASECPSRPSSCSISTPPRTRRRPSAKRWLSYPIPTLIRSILAARGRKWLQPPLAALEDRDLADPEAGEEGERGVVAVADLLREMGVGGEREGGARLDAHLGEGRRRVELADRLAQAGGRDLDRDAALGDRLDRGLVVVARVALGQRPGAAPDLDQVRVGEDVEEARAGGLGEGLEVASPDLVGVAAALPGVPARVVDGLGADEVDRADHVVELPRLEHRGGAVLCAGDEIALDPQPQRRGGDELAVGVEVVHRLFLPERLPPELER